MTDAQGSELIGKIGELTAWVQAADKHLELIAQCAVHSFEVLIFIAAAVGVTALTSLLRKT